MCLGNCKEKMQTLIENNSKQNFKTSLLENLHFVAEDNLVGRTRVFVSMCKGFNLVFFLNYSQISISYSSYKI